MNEPEFKAAAFALAEAPPILKDPVSPPIHWRVENDVTLRVLLADGRTVRAPLAPPKAAVKPAPIHPAVTETTPKPAKPKHASG
jgi:hypothetical protein